MATLETNFYNRTLLGARKGLHFMILKFQLILPPEWELGVKMEIEEGSVHTKHLCLLLYTTYVVVNNGKTAFHSQV